jgi:hypothetical protein
MLTALKDQEQIYDQLRGDYFFCSETGKIKKGLSKKFAKSLSLLMGREGIEPSTYFDTHPAKSNKIFWL